MKIALLHFDFCGGPQELNWEKITKGLRIAKQAGAELVLTPEMALQGYFMAVNKTPHEFYLEGNVLSQHICALSQELAINLLLGTATEDGIGPHNSVVAINSKGAMVHAHNKIHTVKWVTENWAIPGTEVDSCPLGNVRLASLVCADAYFDATTALVQATAAELVTVSAAWPPRGCGGPPRDAWLRCHRSAGNLPTIIVNQTGNSGMDCTDAESAVIRRDGTLFAYSGAEAILLIDYDSITQDIIGSDFEVIKIGKEHSCI